jgi:hypothetical protein
MGSLRDRIRPFALALTLLAPIAWAGDEFWVPTLREGSGYESTSPKYRVVGMEDNDSEHRLFVVADAADVLTQKTVNRIIMDIRRRAPGFTSIAFYKSVGDQPKFPAFAIHEQIADYVAKDNKTYYGVAAKKLYGGWAYGPKP